MKGLLYADIADIKPGMQAPMREFRGSLSGEVISFQELCSAGRLNLRFGREPLGEIYISTMPGGKMYRLVTMHNRR